MPPQPGALRSRWAAYAALSTVLAGGVILKSLAQRPNFYSAAVYLSQSSANLMILCNLVFVTACSFLLLLQKLLYGPLRPIETEQLYEKAWFAVTETCLAMTIFRGEIGAWFLVMFFSLLAGKVWGWIGEGRVEIMEQQQQNLQQGRNAGLFHTRLALSLALGVVFDMTMLEYVVGQVLHMARPDMLVMFGFEFAVLTIMSLSTATRYSLNLIEIGIVKSQKQKRVDAIRKERIENAVRELQARQRQQAELSGGTQQPAQGESDTAESEERTRIIADAAARPVDEAEIEVEGWDGKGRWIFYLDLATDFFKLVVYLSFFFILLIFYGLPLHIMRDVFLTCRSFFKRIGDFMRYRTATRDMNARYPDASEADFGREDVCIICREEMRPYVPPAQGQPTDPVAERMRPKKLPCGHVLHFSCLRSWLERQQICPTCRATVVPTTQTTQTIQAPAPGAAPVAQNARNRGNGRPRVFQFGPLRIGVGAARGNNMLEELEQELANINPLPAQPQNANGPRQFGFGIRWDGVRRRGGIQHRPARGGTGQDMLEAAERQIQRELDTLQASMGELQALRNVQAQLARIRMARQNAQQLPQTTLNTQSRTPTSTVTGLMANQQQNVIPAGSDQLPQGLTLPEGWTMMPLQPIQQPQQLQQQQLPVAHLQMPHIPHLPNFGQMQIGGTIVQGIPHQQVQPPQPPQPPQSPQAPNPSQSPQPSQSNADSSNMPNLQSLTEERNMLASVHARLAEENAELAAQLPRARVDTANPRPHNDTFRNAYRNALDSFREHEESERTRTAPVTAPASNESQTRSTSTQPRQTQVTTRVTSTHNSHPSQTNSSTQSSQVTTSVRSSRMSPPSTRVQISSTAPRVLPARTAPAPSVSSSESSDGNNNTRRASSHRPTRSIGSSWGFSTEERNDGRNRNRPHNGRSNGEDHDDDEDDEDDEDSDEAEKETGRKTNQQPVPTRAGTHSLTTVQKGRKPTVEDDDDDEESGDSG